MTLFLLCIIVFIVASCFGSFFKLIVDRYNTDKSFIFDSSHCPNCKTKLSWWHNLPIIGFILLKGNCFFCKKPIDINCLFSELATGAIISFVFYHLYTNSQNYLEILLVIFTISVMILLSIFDLKHKIVPHTITYSTIVIILLLNSIQQNSSLIPIRDLGIAFIAMDLIYFFANLIKRFGHEQNPIVIPLFIWAIIFFFNQNLFLLIIPIIIYFTVHKFDKFSNSPYLWISFSALLSVHLYNFSIDKDKLNLLFFGIGAIYFTCEIAAYLLNSLITKGKTDDEDQNESLNFSMGGGDITFVGLISVFLGFQYAFLALFIASCLGSATFIASYIGFKLSQSLKRSKGEYELKYLPFIPYLSFACFIIIITLHGR